MSDTNSINWGNWILRVLIALFVASCVVAIGKEFQESEGSERAGIIQEDTTDEMTGNRSIRTRRADAKVLKPEKVTTSAEAFLYYINQTSELYPDGIPKYYLILEVESGNWNFGKGDTVYFLVDGDRYTREVDVYDMGIGTSVSEEIGVRLEKENFRRRLAKSEEVKVKVGRYVWDITEALNQEMQALQDAVQDAV